MKKGTGYGLLGAKAAQAARRTLALAFCFFLIFQGFSGLVGARGEEASPLDGATLSALFINVGKGDCALFFVEDKVFMVDAGPKGAWENVLRALETYGVERLHGVFITHTDKDHVGGLKKLLKSSVAVEQLYAPALHSYEDASEHPVYEASVDYEVPLTWLRAQDLVPAGEKSTFTVLGPLTRDMEDENNNSLVLHLQTPYGSMLLTGDMEKEEEAELLAAGVVPQAEVLKVAHHGKKDSSSEIFIYTVRPQWAVICTDSNVEPSSPAASVLKRLWNCKAGVAVTQDASCGIWVTLAEGKASAQAIHYTGE